MLEIKYSEIAVKQLKKISTLNSKDAERIISGIEKYAVTLYCTSVKRTKGILKYC